MRTFLIFVFLIATALPLSVLKFIAPLSQNLQTKCASLVPENLKHRNLSQSFLCGTKIENVRAKETFRQTGLLHLMVVSGGHLQLIAFFFLLPWPKRIQKSKAVIVSLWLVMGFYCLATGFQAPVVRAFASRLISALRDYFHWHWDFGKVQWMSGLLLLAIFPLWISNFSFYLSWLATLGFLLSPLVSHQHWTWRFLQLWISCLLIQTLLAVGFLQFSWLSVFANGLFAPVIALTLLPLSALTCLWPELAPWTDQGWSLLLDFLFWIQTHFASEDFDSFHFPTTSPRWISLWIFLALVHCAFEALRQSRYRSSHV